MNDYRNPACKHGVPWYSTCYSCAADAASRRGSDIRGSDIRGVDAMAEQLAAQAYSGKPSNPKDAIATDKAPLHLVPAAFKAYTAMALAEGALKYGANNWRAAGVRASVYKSALDRHLDKWWNGEELDPATGVPHLANACACLAILIDAKVSEKLTDDRPPRQKQLSQLLDGAVPTTIAGLRRVFGSTDPKHWTINDEITNEGE